MFPPRAWQEAVRTVQPLTRPRSQRTASAPCFPKGCLPLLAALPASRVLCLCSRLRVGTGWASPPQAEPGNQR